MSQGYHIRELHALMSCVSSRLPWIRSPLPCSIYFFQLIVYL
jgi:hypothetical protein